MVLSADKKKRQIELMSPQEIVALSEPPLTLGSCVLKMPEVAGIVQNAFLYFEEKRYYLSAWCVMPNHVHVVVTPLGEWILSDILYSWKSYMAKEINKIIGQSGQFWERESFDHLIRSFDDWNKFVLYVEQNPVMAGLCSKAADWRFSSCSAGAGGATPFQPAKDLEFVNPQDTPFVEMQSRGELPHLFKPGCTYFVTFRLIDAVVFRR